MNSIRLPRSSRASAPAIPADSRQITIIGANGAGKSRFMEEMTALCDDKAFCLSALNAFFPEREESTLPGSIDMLYRDAVRQQSYMRTDAVSQLDKISYMLFADELEYLLDIKEQNGNGKIQMKPTKLDRIKRVWERIFPGNKITRDKGKLMFATTAGDDLISSHALSQGEKAVLYYIGAVLYAPQDAVVFIDSPSLFVHPAITANLWDTIEQMRRDCTFVYNSVDVDFVNSRTQNTCIWVKNYDSERHAWDYEVLASSILNDDLVVELAGSRKPVLFIEGDARHSIDARLYSLVFPDRNIRPLGSCSKVIETTRSFNDLSTLHHLQSWGIVDRDRRSDQEVEYLRNKNILVPEVAEVENIFLLPTIIKVMAGRRGRDAAKVLGRVERNVVKAFKAQADQQALQHVRHKVKRDVECKIDSRFTCITALETHIKQLIVKLQPRKHYNALREQFAALVRDFDYEGILRVFNHKPMLSDSEVHSQLGFHSKEDYIAGVLDAMRGNGKDAETLRQCVIHCLRADEERALRPPSPQYEPYVPPQRRKKKNARSQ